MPSSPTRCAVAKQARDRGGAPFQRSAVGIGGGAIDHYGTPAGNGHPAEPLRHRETRVAGDPDPLQPITAISRAVTAYSPIQR
jgi:hypothetical protein